MSPTFRAGYISNFIKMPAEDYFSTDNFFKKMTDLESPKKNNDCYFYYYSTCARGDSCQFRHEPSALGCETMCSFWKEGKCLNIHCNFRHMELRKNRKAIPCYWESQPTGCLKAHCPFMHQHPRPDEDQGFDKLNDNSMDNSVFTDQRDRKVTAVERLVVNCEEESDNESLSSFSPMKNINRIVRVKTLEEIRLEKIQAESAAFYSYHDEDMESDDPNDLRQRLLQRVPNRQDRRSHIPPFYRNDARKIRANKRLSNDEMANILGDESLRKKTKVACYDAEEQNLDVITKRAPIPNHNSTISKNIQPNTTPNPNQTQDKTEATKIHVKTLAEIRAEKNAKNQMPPQPQVDVVTSTSVEDHTMQKSVESAPRRKIKLKRKLVATDKLEVSNDFSEKFSDSAEISMEANSDFGSNIDEEVLLEDDDDFDTIALRAEEDLLDEDDF